MSRIEELLRQKRAAQIRRMEGTPDEAAEAEIDAKLSEESRRGRQREARPPRSRHLRFTKHARQRMAQRGWKAGDVYALWRAGERIPQTDGRAVYCATRAALDEADEVDRRRLEKFLGAAIVVSEGTADSLPILVTVLADGEDTRVGNWKGR